MNSQSLSSIDLTPISDKLQALEGHRQRKYRLFKRVKPFSRVLSFCFYAAMICGAGNILLPFLLPFFIPVYIVGGTAFVLHTILQHTFLAPTINTYRKRFEEEIIIYALKQYHPDFRFIPEKGVPEASIRQSQLFPTKIERYRGEDLAQGKIAGVSTRFSDIRLTITKYGLKELTKDIIGTPIALLLGLGDEIDFDGKEILLFKGIFFQVDLNSGTEGNTLIVSSAPSYMRKFDKRYQKNRKILSMNHTAFNERYVIYTDQIIPHQKLLNPELLDLLVEIGKTYDAQVYTSFFPHTLFVGFHWAKDFMNRNIDSPVPEIEELEEYFAEIRLIEQMILLLKD